MGRSPISSHFIPLLRRKIYRTQIPCQQNYLRFFAELCVFCDLEHTRIQPVGFPPFIPPQAWVPQGLKVPGSQCCGSRLTGTAVRQYDCTGRWLSVGAPFNVMSWGSLSDWAGRELTYTLAFVCVLGGIGVLAVAGIYPILDNLRDTAGRQFAGCRAGRLERRPDLRSDRQLRLGARPRRLLRRTRARHGLSRRPAASPASARRTRQRSPTAIAAQQDIENAVSSPLSAASSPIPVAVALGSLLTVRGSRSGPRRILRVTFQALRVPRVLPRAPTPRRSAPRSWRGRRPAP